MKEMTNNEQTEEDMSLTTRLPRNVHGKYFTTDDCDGCAYCASVAPNNFDFDRENNQYHVSKQPATPEEEEYMQEAKDDCPVDAIRVDEDDNGKR